MNIDLLSSVGILLLSMGIGFSASGILYFFGVTTLPVLASAWVFVFQLAANIFSRIAGVSASGFPKFGVMWYFSIERNSKGLLKDLVTHLLISLAVYYLFLLEAKSRLL